MNYPKNPEYETRSFYYNKPDEISIWLNSFPKSLGVRVISMVVAGTYHDRIVVTIVKEEIL